MRRRLPRPTWPTRAALIAAFATIGFTWAYLIWMYPDLPFGVPVRFVKGRALIYQLKSPLLVMLPVVVQLTFAAVIAPLVVLLLWRARPIASDGWDQDAHRMRQAAEGIALLGFVWIAVQAFGAVRLIRLWERGNRGFGDAFGEVYVFALVTALALSIVIGTRTAIVLAEGRRALAVDDPRLWHLRCLYVNPQDPALFVPARRGSGWTLNFGRPLATLAMVCTLGFGVIVPYYVAFQVLKGYWR